MYSYNKECHIFRKYRRLNLMTTSKVIDQIKPLPHIEEGDLVITTLFNVVLVTNIEEEVYYSGVVVASPQVAGQVGAYSMNLLRRDCSRFHGSVLLTS